MSTKEKVVASVSHNSIDPLKVRLSKEQLMNRIEATVRWHCGLTKEELFNHQLDAGTNYIKGRVSLESDYKKLIANKGFWNWYRQIWCKGARWLIEENDWAWYSKDVTDWQYDSLRDRKQFDDFGKWVAVKADGYGFEPVLMSMYNGREYEGRVIY